MKHWVIPDIHGCYKTLRKLVEDQISPSKEDTITFLGDYIDRGPHSKKVIDYVMMLQEEMSNINCLRGNHEEFMLQAYYKEVNRKWHYFYTGNPMLNLWKSVGGKQAMQSFRVSKVSDVPKKYIEWLENLKHYILTEKFVIVHAGLNFDIDDPFSDLEAMTQIRNFEVVPEKIGNRRIIHGHVPLSIDFIKSNLENPESPFIALDNGCYHRTKPNLGSLTALEINNLEIVSQVNIDII